MHSSRMRTGRSLTVCRSLLPGGGGSAPGGREVSAPRGGSAPGGGVCLGVVVSQHALRQTPPVNRITDTSKNITLATNSLWPVMNSSRMRTIRCSSHPSRGRGVCLGGGGVYHLLLLCGQTDTCENITFPQLLLRTVINTAKLHKHGCTCFSLPKIVPLRTFKERLCFKSPLLGFNSCQLASYCLFWQLLMINAK